MTHSPTTTSKIFWTTFNAEVPQIKVADENLPEVCATIAEKIIIKLTEASLYTYINDREYVQAATVIAMLVGVAERLNLSQPNDFCFSIPNDSRKLLSIRLPKSGRVIMEEIVRQSCFGHWQYHIHEWQIDFVLVSVPGDEFSEMLKLMEFKFNQGVNASTHK